MFGLLLAATLTTGQVDVGAYYGYGQPIYVQAEPYYEVEDQEWVEPDSSEYPQYDFTDGGDPGDGGDSGTRAAIFGAGGVVVLQVTDPYPGQYQIFLSVYPNTGTTGRLVTVSGWITVTFSDENANVQLEYSLPVFAVFLSPRTSWTWRSGMFTGVPPGSFLTARFVGHGFGTGPAYWTCPGVTESITID